MAKFKHKDGCDWDRLAYDRSVRNGKEAWILSCPKCGSEIDMLAEKPKAEKPKMVKTVDKAIRQYLKARAKEGFTKYGVPLMPFNGRNPSYDALEEAADLMVYQMQAIMEREKIAHEIHETWAVLQSSVDTGDVNEERVLRSVSLLQGIEKKMMADIPRASKEEPCRHGNESKKCGACAQFDKDLMQAAQYEVVPREPKQRFFYAGPGERLEQMDKEWQSSQEWLDPAKAYDAPCACLICSHPFLEG